VYKTDELSLKLFLHLLYAISLKANQYITLVPVCKMKFTSKWQYSSHQFINSMDI